MSDRKRKLKYFVYLPAFLTVLWALPFYDWSYSIEKGIIIQAILSFSILSIWSLLPYILLLALINRSYSFLVVILQITSVVIIKIIATVYFHLIVDGGGWDLYLIPIYQVVFVAILYVLITYIENKLSDLSNENH